jgi:hypothetical protein
MARHDWAIGIEAAVETAFTLALQSGILPRRNRNEHDG